MFHLDLVLTLLVKRYACYNKDLGQTSNCPYKQKSATTENFTELHVVTRTSVQTACLVLTLKATYFRTNLRKENLYFIY